MMYLLDTVGPPAVDAFTVTALSSPFVFASTYGKQQTTWSTSFLIPLIIHSFLTPRQNIVLGEHEIRPLLDLKNWLMSICTLS